MKNAYFSIAIPTNQSFAQKWYHWTYAKVARHFKRDKERAFDTAQNVRLHLLSKDFIGRWFFKHLSDELVDRAQAERILGGAPLTFIGSVQPVDSPNFACRNKACVARHIHDRGCVRSCINSLWRISDLMEFAKFNHDRYYYTPQGHTIDSGKFLSLLGYPETQYTLLQSLYRQGRIKPAEFTEHVCIGDGCIECDHGRDLLKSRGLSLAHNWNDPSVSDAASKLRWNDDQLKQFLREWRRSNMIKTTPLYIKRQISGINIDLFTSEDIQKVNACLLGYGDNPNYSSFSPPSSGETFFDYAVNHGVNSSLVKGVKIHGVDAGLLRYAEKIIDNRVKNDFKYMSRTVDAQSTVFNNGVSPELSNSDQIAWSSDESSDDEKILVEVDPTSIEKFLDTEKQHDLSKLFHHCSLTDEESDVLSRVDFNDISVREVSEKLSKPIQKIHRIRQSAIKKLRNAETSLDTSAGLASQIAERYKCSVADMLSTKVIFGPAIVARSHFFGILYDSGLSINEISTRYGMSEDRVISSIYRSVLHAQSIS